MGGGPVVGGGRVRILGAERDGLLGRDIRRAEQVGLGGRFSLEPGLELGRLGESGEDVGQVVQLDELRGRLDRLGFVDPLAGSFVHIAAAAAERHILGDGEVVDFVVDQNHAAELSDAGLVAVEEAAQLRRGRCQEVGSLQSGVRGEFAEQVVAARIHPGRLPIP